MGPRTRRGSERAAHDEGERARRVGGGEASERGRATPALSAPRSCAQSATKHDPRSERSCTHVNELATPTPAGVSRSARRASEASGDRASAGRSARVRRRRPRARARARARRARRGAASANQRAGAGGARRGRGRDDRGASRATGRGDEEGRRGRARRSRRATRRERAREENKPPRASNTESRVVFTLAVLYTRRSARARSPDLPRRLGAPSSPSPPRRPSSPARAALVRPPRVRGLDSATSARSFSLAAENDIVARSRASPSSSSSSSPGSFPSHNATTGVSATVGNRSGSTPCARRTRARTSRTFRSCWSRRGRRGRGAPGRRRRRR